MIARNSTYIVHIVLSYTTRTIVYCIIILLQQCTSISVVSPHHSSKHRFFFPPAVPSGAYNIVFLRLCPPSASPYTTHVSAQLQCCAFDYPTRSSICDFARALFVSSAAPVPKTSVQPLHIFIRLITPDSRNLSCVFVLVPNRSPHWQRSLLHLSCTSLFLT